MVDDRAVGAIGPGILALVGVEAGDGPDDARYVADKIAGLRLFSDAAGKFNLCLEETRGEVLVVSQFTLHGDCRKGRRPSFTRAARPEEAIPLYESVAAQLRARGFTVATGEFGAMMSVRLVNDGPVTLMIDSRKEF